jgi:quercetin dioxygenase-like cupin family protein
MDNPDWSWPDSLDALVAAPGHHTLLLENERIRVLETHIPPGDTTPIHTHRWPSVYYITSWSQFLRTDDKGWVIVGSRKVESLAEPPTVLWSEALPPHALQNVGDADIRLVSVEPKASNTILLV